MTLTAVVIYDSVLFNRTGQVRRWADALERRFTFNAQQAAPVRSGELRAGIFGEVIRIGPRHLQTSIASTAPHSMYVLRGTEGPIFSDLAWANGGSLVEGERDELTGIYIQHGYMKLRAGNGYGSLYRLSVSGQESQNFFQTAARQTAARHPSLRGFDPDFRY